MCKTFLQRVMSALWRRRSSALIAVMSLTIVLVFLQYHNVRHSDVEGNTPIKAHHRELHSVDVQTRITTLTSEVKDEFRVDREDKQLDAPNINHIETVMENNNVPKVENKNFESVGAVPAPNSQGLSGGINQPNSQMHEFKGGNIPNYNVFSMNSNFKPVFDNGNSAGVTSQPVYVPKHRLFHLDLKGAPPKVDYLKKLFVIMKQLGATGVVLEYEDTFPYENELAPIAGKHHYSKEDVTSIVQLCRENNFEVIPLIQTFGHVEFILKVSEFMSLREVPKAPQAFCPSNNETMLVIQEMIDQMMALHPNIKWLHIGCDEVYQLGSCTKCMARNIEEGRDSLFISHVAKVASYVKQRYHVIPIIWDDMLHHFSAEQMKRYDLGNLVEPMVWTYVSDVYRFIPHEIWTTYGEVFPYIWSASAFKGAFGEQLVVPPVKTHLENNLAWLDVMSHEQFRFREFRGIAITGWQRYDHFAALCELLPAAVPSLAVCMSAVSHGYFNESWRQELYDVLGCMRSQKYMTFIDLDQDPYLWDKMSWCFFPGVTFFKVTEKLENLRKVIKDFVNDETVKKAWLTDYNLRHNYSSLQRIENSMSNFPFIYPDVETLLRHARDTLREVFQESTVAEWIELHIYPMLQTLDKIKKSAETLKAVDSWKVRPLDPIPELAKYGIGLPSDNNKQEKK
ncbi:hypothetical protein CHUAL_002973 [Chamberlinius hualienensis]